MPKNEELVALLGGTPQVHYWALFCFAQRRGGKRSPTVGLYTAVSKKPIEATTIHPVSLVLSSIHETEKLASNPV